MGLDDWAGVQFLNTIPAIVGIVPRFYGGEFDNELFIMEDLSENEGQLKDILEGDDIQLAEATLIECMVATGKIHAATIGRKGEYQRLRDTLGPTPDKTFHKVNRIIEGLKGFEQMAQITRVNLSPQAYQDLEFALTELQNPGSLLAYTQGDLAPGNCLRFQNQIKLYDFEMGQYRHALIDRTYPHIRYLTCSNAGQLPSGIKKRMETAYRGELIKGCPEAADDLRFSKSVVVASAGWLATQTAFLPIVLDQDREHGWLTLRQKILGCLEAFTNITEEHNHLLALGATTREMWKRLKNRWSNEVNAIPYFPVFG